MDDSKMIFMTSMCNVEMWKAALSGNKGERRENKWEISVRGTEHERLLTLGKSKGGWKRR